MNPFTKNFIQRVSERAKLLNDSGHEYVKKVKSLSFEKQVGLFVTNLVKDIFAVSIYGLITASIVVFILSPQTDSNGEPIYFKYDKKTDYFGLDPNIPNQPIKSPLKLIYQLYRKPSQNPDYKYDTLSTILNWFIDIFMGSYLITNMLMYIIITTLQKLLKRVFNSTQSTTFLKKIILNTFLGAIFLFTGLLFTVINAIVFFSSIAGQTMAMLSGGWKKTPPDGNQYVTYMYNGGLVFMKMILLMLSLIIYAPLALIKNVQVFFLMFFNMLLENTNAVANMWKKLGIIMLIMLVILTAINGYVHIFTSLQK